MSELSNSQQPQAIAALRVLSGPRHGDKLAVTSTDITVGKGADSAIVLDDDSVSTRHAELQLKDGRWRITDLNSTNGTYVEGTRLAPEVPTPLQFGSSIRFGGVRVQFLEVHHAEAEAVHAEPTPAEPRIDAPVSRGFRLPVWVLVLLVLVLLVGILIYRWTTTPVADIPVPGAVALLQDLTECSIWL